MKRAILLFVFVSSIIFSQNNWNLIWKMEQKPFLEPQTGSEMAIVKAGFDTDEDGWGEFLCAWTDKDPDNYLLMYEATGDNTYELVWYFNYPASANTFAGIAVGDIDNNGVVDIVTTMPSVANVDRPNPPRLWVFEWNGVQGENSYGNQAGQVGVPNYEWNFDVEDNFDFRPYSLIIEDIDKDGTNELIAGVRQSGSGSLRQVYVCSATGSLTGFGSLQVEYNFAQEFGGSLYSVTTGDLDSDGNNEIYAFIWNYFTMRIFECMGDQQYEEVFAVDELYSGESIDYGALDAVRVTDVNNDGVKEMYIAGTEDPNMLFTVTNISDVSQMTADDIKEFYHIPINVDGGLRSMHVADPDGDGNLSLMIAGERNGQIYDLEYKGEGDPADSNSWDLNILFDIYELADTASSISPRLFYGHPGGDLDNDGKEEYLFVNYASSFTNWQEDAYLWIIEIDQSTGVKTVTSIVPDAIELKQNYPNPFNPSTKIKFTIPIVGRSVTSPNEVKLIVYDILGGEIATLVNEIKAPGTYEIEFDASKYSSGVYYYTLQVGGTIQTKKMILVK